MPEYYEVYLFYYPSTTLHEDLENRLKALGEITGKNLFVNIGKLNDPNFKKIKTNFGILDLPVIIITRLSGIASVKTEKYYATLYVRTDSQRLMESTDLAIKSVERIFNLF